MHFIFGAVFAILGSIFWRFPPKKINSFYGYRTPSSMKNQRSWDVAQKCSARLMTILGLVCVAVDLAVINFFPELSGAMYGACVLGPEIIITVVVVLVVTEIAIKRANKDS